jgi:hypothetical protein
MIGGVKSHALQNTHIQNSKIHEVMLKKIKIIIIMQ